MMAFLRRSFFLLAIGVGAALWGPSCAAQTLKTLPASMVGSNQAELFWEQSPKSVRDFCPASPQASLTAVEEPHISLDESHSIRVIQQLREGSPVAKRVPHSAITLGFYQASKRYTMKTTAFFRPVGSRYVACVKSWDATITSNAKVFIGSELYYGTCARKDVVHHEVIHYQIDQQTTAQLQKEVPRIGAQFSAIYFGDTPEQAQRAAQGATRDFQAMLERRKAELNDPLQKAHDSPEEYARTTRACNGAIAQIAKTAMIDVR